MKILQSYRWRRRLIFAAVAVAIAVPLGYFGAKYSISASQNNANGPVVPNYKQPKHAAFTAENRRAVHSVLKEFISTAVVRRHVGRSWDIAGPSLKQGVSRREWNRGDIPVIPYPAANRRLGSWSYVEYSYRNLVGLEVFLFPKPGSGWSAMSADVEVVKGRDGHWRVNYWMPKRFHGPPSVAAPKKKPHQPHGRHGAKPQHEAAPNPAGPTSHVGAWRVFPFVLLGLAVLLPIAIGLGVWYRNRRAQAAYLRSKG